jgi:flagellar basal body-associated protein FliL
MQAIEIRHNKKKAILYMASLVIVIVGMTVYVTFFGKAGNNYFTFIDEFLA